MRSIPSSAYDRTNLRVLSIAIATVMIGFGLFGPFLPLYAELLGANIGLQIGAIVASFTLTRAICSIPVGWLSDRIGRKNVISLGVFLYAIVTLTLAFSGDWIQLLILRGIQGATSAFIWTPATTIIADSTPPERRGRALSVFNSSAMTGLIMGPALGGAIQIWTKNYFGLQLLDSFRSPFLFGAVLASASSLIVWMYARETHSGSASARTDEGASTKLNPKFRATFYTLMALAFANGFTLGFTPPLMVYFAEHEYGLSVESTAISISIAFFLSGVTNAVVQLIGGRLADSTRKKKTIMILSILVSQLVAVLLPMSPTVFLFVSLYIIRSGLLALLRPSLFAFQEDLMPKRIRGKLTGVMDTMRSAGAVSGPILGFLFYDLISPSTPFYLGAGIFLVATLFFYVYAREPKIEESEA